jgi:diguanylate cyclase (GGDEF)-like protein
MGTPSSETNTGLGGEHGHLVEFYETEDFLVETVRAFVEPALRDGDAAIVVATEAHRLQFEKALRAARLDVDAATREGRYLAFDAAEMLSGLMVGGKPEPDRFHETVAEIMDRASHGGRQVRVYGEMVTLLWDQRDVASALALEDLWNDLAETRTFVLLCAYPLQAFDDEASAGPFRRVCEQHTRVIPSEGYSLHTDPAERERAVAQMQQRTEALRGEVRRLRAQEHRASHDDLTGVYLRGPGFVELEREIMRAHRTGQPLVVAFADVDRLKAINDSRGHAAGDLILLEVVKCFRQVLRSYDLIIRYGGDEFVCAMSGMAMADATKRIALFDAALAETPERGSVTVGLAELAPGDSPEDLVARADAEFYRERQLQRSASD